MFEHLKPLNISLSYTTYPPPKKNHNKINVYSNQKKKKEEKKKNMFEHFNWTNILPKKKTPSAWRDATPNSTSHHMITILLDFSPNNLEHGEKCSHIFCISL